MCLPSLLVMGLVILGCTLKNFIGKKTKNQKQKQAFKKLKEALVKKLNYLTMTRMNTSAYEICNMRSRLPVRTEFPSIF